MEKRLKDLNVGILTSIMLKANLMPLNNLVKIIESLSENLLIIEVYDQSIVNNGNKYKNSKVIRIIHRSSKLSIFKLFYLILDQIIISYHILHFRKINVWFFNIGDILIIPMIIATLLRKNTIVILGGYLEKELEFKHNLIISRLLINLKKIVLNLSNRILLYSPSLVKTWGLDNYKNKIIISHRHFVNFEIFKINTEYKKRENIIGFIGRLSEEKGIINFIEAINLLQNTNNYRNNDLKVLILGSGPLEKDVNDCIDKMDLNIKLINWVPHEKLPIYLNKLKLLIIPSYTEGLPNLMLEAMACGTPVLANSVGAIPDVIKNCRNGFLITDNSPDVIADNIIKALSYPNLDQIIKNATKTIKEEYSYQKCIDNFNEILNDHLKK